MQFLHLPVHITESKIKHIKVDKKIKYLYFYSIKGNLDLQT